VLGEADAVKECKNENGAYITYTLLKQFYEEHLTIARRLEVPKSREELKEI